MASPAAEAVDPVSRRPVILTVDDSRDIIQMLHGVLGELYQCHFATDGRAALALLDRVSPDLILLDLMMPGLSGFDVLRCLKADPRHATIPVIIVTAAGVSDEETRVLEAGAADFITKPINVRVLLARVHTHLALAESVRSLRHTVRELETHQAAMRSYFATAADWYWEMDAELCFAGFSENFEHVYGRPAVALLGKRRIDLLRLDPQIDLAIVEKHAQVLERRESFRDFRYRVLLGSRTQWVSISGDPVFTQSGRFAGYRGSGRIVSREMEAEIEREWQKLLLDSVVGTVPVGLLLLDDQLRVVNVNPYFREVLQSEDVPLVLPADLDELGGLLGRLGSFLADDTAAAFVTAVRHHADGMRERPFEFNWQGRRQLALSYLTLVGGWCVLTCLDITSFRKSEATLSDMIRRSRNLNHELMESMRLLQQLINDVPQGMLLISGRGDVLAYNRQFGDLLAISGHASWVGRHFRDEVLREIELLQPVAVALVAALRERADDSFEKELNLGLLGTVDRWLALSHTGGRQGERIVVLSDITRRKVGELESMALTTSLAEELADTTVSLQDAQRVLMDTSASLRSVQEKFQALVLHLKEVFWIVSPDFSQISYITDTCQVLFGVSAATLYVEPHAWRKAIHREDQPRVREFLRQLRNTVREQYEFPEFRVRNAAGDERWVRARGYPVFAADGTQIQIAGFFEDVTESRLASDRLAQSMQNFNRSLVARVEDERRRLSQELHDEVGQLLTALKLHIGRASANPDPRVIASALDNATHISGEMMVAVRNIVHQLQPPQLADLGLAAALRWHIERFARSAPTRFLFEEQLGKRRFAPEIELAVFRVIQEAMTNIVRHASANEGVITLASDANTLKFSVWDDGAGFEPGQRQDLPGHLGLHGIRERVQGLGGTVDIRSSPGMGTEISGQVPLNSPEAQT